MKIKVVRYMQTFPPIEAYDVLYVKVSHCISFLAGLSTVNVKGFFSIFLMFNMFPVCSV